MPSIFLKVIGKHLQEADGYLWHERNEGKKEGRKGKKDSMFMNWKTVNTVEMAIIPKFNTDSFQALSKS